MSPAVHDWESFWFVNGSAPTLHQWQNERGFLFGLRVMTTMRVSRGFVIDGKRHLERLLKHAEAFGFSPCPRFETLAFELQGALDVSKIASGVCRVFLQAGPGAMTSPLGEPLRWVQVQSSPPPSVQDSDQGLNLSLNLSLYQRQLTPDSNQNVRVSSHVTADLKSGNYFDAVALAHRQKNSSAEILWLNTEREVLESSTGNIFFVGREGDLVEIATPRLEQGILAGVTRRRIMELLLRSKIPVTERTIDAAEIPRFDEAFVTSSLSGLRPVAQIGQHRLATLRPSSSTRHFMRLYETWASTFDAPLL
jgi:branched-subunit amino acid aminotransferase/4-amino-4-deoxychorismate lyase